MSQLFGDKYFQPKLLAISFAKFRVLVRRVLIIHMLIILLYGIIITTFNETNIIVICQKSTEYTINCTLLAI